jgi:hypothetical protein
MQVSYDESTAPDIDAIPDRPGADIGLDRAAVPVSGPLRQELRTNLAVAGFSLGLSVAVAVALALLMTLLG